MASGRGAGPKPARSGRHPARLGKRGPGARPYGRRARLHRGPGLAGRWLGPTHSPPRQLLLRDQGRQDRHDHRSRRRIGRQVPRHRLKLHETARPVDTSHASRLHQTGY